MIKPLLGLLLALPLLGCATARTLDAAKPGAPLVYAGTRLDVYALRGCCCPRDHFGADAPQWPAVDLPASLLLDTLLLPLSVLTAVGVGVQGQGGF